VSDLQIESILNGVATGDYLRRIGSQFGSIWRFDGLTAAEATPAEYAAFGASGNTKLGHGEDVDWLGRKWGTILAYRHQSLAQVSVYTDFNDQFMASILTKLSLLLGKPKESPTDFFWVGRGGVVTLTKSEGRLQIDARQFRLLERLIKGLLGR
jgi:hypothetical protein